MRQIVLDTETTGIGKDHRIIEIGGMEMINRRFTNQHFHVYLNPERDIDPRAQAVHGISQEFLTDKPLFKEIANDFICFVDKAELIIHNAPFDIGFINYEFELMQQNLPAITDFCTVLDTLVLARSLHPGQKNNLDILCKRYGIDISQRELHGALKDAKLLAQVYLAMTGGQGSLFGREDVQAAHSLTPLEIQHVIASCNHLRVIKADIEESLAHENYIAFLNQSTANNCLWNKSNSE